MTSFKQSAEEILEAYYEYRQSQEGDGNVPPKNSLSTEEALEQLEVLHHESVQKITINGKDINEVVMILNGLELERILGIEVTMKNLNIFVDAMRRELRETNQNAINKAFERLTLPLKDKE